MSFLNGYFALVVGVLALALTLVSRRATKEPMFRQDVGGASVWFTLFLVIRLAAGWAEAVVPQDWHPWLRAGWMLSFAFGTVRFFVAVALGLRRRFGRVPMAKIYRDVFDFIFYVVTAIPILKFQLKLDVTTLLGTSAVLSLVLGFALQDTLSNLFSGLSLQMEQPFMVGDIVRVGQHVGKVVQISWRSTRLETSRKELVSVPNAMLSKEVVLNYSKGGQPVGVDVMVGLSYDVPPNQVKAEIFQALRELSGVLQDPAPSVRLVEYQDSAVQYKIGFFVADFLHSRPIRDELLSRLWYRLGRAGIEMPYPQRVVTMKAAPARDLAFKEQLLGELQIFAPFPIEERRDLVQKAVERRFGMGERVVTEGREGDTFYVVAEGRLSVQVGKPPKEVATLGRGQHFGEMSLLTGEPRAATVVALSDCLLLELSREAFASHFTERPERAQELAELLSRRRAELEAATSAEGDRTEGREAGRILARLRAIFGLR
jgi:small-conductance mechanosensitive channel/CRP-like cAMP-binding protein